MDHPRLREGRVIIPYGRSVMALVAAQSLSRQGIEVIGCDAIDFTVLSFSKHVADYFTYPDPDKDEAAFLAFMEETVIARKPEDDRPYVLMPIYKDTPFYAQHRGRFERHIQIAAPDFGAIRQLQPKDNFARTVKDLMVTAPETWLPEDRTALEGLAPELPYPVVIKPYDLTGGRGIHKVPDQDTLLRLWDENQDRYGQCSLIQAMADGEDYCLTALYDHGTRKASMAYRNVHRFPADSGAGILRETVADDRLIPIADNLMGPLDWTGVAEFDFIWDGHDDTVPALIEVNTRFWGGLFQSVESGIDFPWLLYQLTVNGAVEAAAPAQIGTRTKMPYIWLISALSEVLKDDDAFAGIEDQGKTALAKAKEGRILEAAQEYTAYLGGSLGQAFNVRRKAEHLRQVLAVGRGARDELLTGDDPKAILGVLFVLGSLLKYGELPREVRY